MNQNPYLSNSDYLQKKLQILDPLVLLEYLKSIEEQDHICVYNQQEKGNGRINLFTTFIHQQDTQFPPDGGREISFPDEQYYLHYLPYEDKYVTEYPLIYKRFFPNAKQVFHNSTKSYDPIFNPLILGSHKEIFDEESHFGYVSKEGSTRSLVFIDTEKNIAFANYSNLTKFLKSIGILESVTNQNEYLAKDYKLVIYFTLSYDYLPSKHPLFSVDLKKEDYKDHGIDFKVWSAETSGGNYSFRLEGRKEVNFSDDPQESVKFMISRKEEKTLKEISKNSLSMLSFRTGVLDKYRKSNFCSIEPYFLIFPESRIQINPTKDDKIISIFTYQFERVPASEHYYWKSYNVPPSFNFSTEHTNRIVRGTPSDPEQIYYRFQAVFEKTYGLYKPYLRDKVVDKSRLKIKKCLEKMIFIDSESHNTDDLELKLLDLYILLKENLADFLDLSDFKEFEGFLKRFSVYRHNRSHLLQEITESNLSIQDFFNKKILPEALIHIENIFSWMKDFSEDEIKHNLARRKQ